MTDPIKDYCSLERQKRALLDQKADIDARMEPLKALIIAQSVTTGQKILEVTPSDGEEALAIGATGALVVKTTNKYEDFNRANLRSACLKYFRMLSPEHELEVLEKIAYGQAEYMWAERECREVLSVERTFVEPPSSKARAKPVAKRQKTVAKAKEVLPKTREDFCKLNIFDQL